MATGKSLAEVQSWPNKELREWAAFERIHPFPSQRSDVQAAIIAQASVSPWGKPPKLTSLIPDYTKNAVQVDGLEAARQREQELANAIPWHHKPANHR